MELSEQEKYALFANVPYLINEGVPIKDIELEFKQYGLDYKIDNELTDAISSTIVGKDDVVHSVRGTDIKSFKDLISDANIITSHPTFIRLFNTLIATTGGLPLLVGDTKISDEIKTALYGMYSGYDALTKWDEGPEMSREEWEEELTRLENRVRQIQTRELRQNRRNTLIGGTALLSSALALTQTKRLITDNFRIEPERIKLNKVKDKYPNKNVSLTGHSLGSVVNILGRKNNIKTISFNPAPQETDSILKAHPESKAYLIKNDPVSYFLTSDDTEKRTFVKQKVSNPHSLSNFLPNKQLSQKELKEQSPKTIISEKPEFDFCKFFPDNPKCKNIIYA